ncbi:putative hydrolase [Mycobacterium tuberculosis]|nr:putative hydrolase [Mycobacterium tuberculosis]CND65093.1 putative hydrolase [Mycobacterium tuberculosis]CNJ33794.1 putative hydrolase [Mycobacterium tuberculosis]
MFETLTAIDPDAEEAALIERIAELERLKSAAAAGQARAAAAVDAARRAAEGAAGVPAARRGRGLASEIALARRDSPARGSRHLGFAKALVYEMPHTLAALDCGALSEWRATLIVRESACLDVADRRALDAELCGDPGDLEGMGDARVVAAARAIAYRLDPQAVVDAAALAESFSEVHPLPGRDLMPVVDGASADEGRAIYLMTRDNVLEGDTGASLLSRQLGRIVNPPAPLRIKVPAHVAANFEGLVVRVDDTDAAGGAGHLWKLVRTFDDPATWTEPGVRHLATNGMGGDAYRTDPLDDQWELYDLTADPIEAYNRWTDPQLHELRQHLRMLLKQQRAVSVPERNQPWPYAHRLPPSGASNGLVRRVLGRFVR